MVGKYYPVSISEKELKKIERSREGKHLKKIERALDTGNWEIIMHSLEWLKNYAYSEAVRFAAAKAEKTKENNLKIKATREVARLLHHTNVWWGRRIY